MCQSTLILTQKDLRMVCVKWCAVCMRETLHSGIRDTCTACKSRIYHERRQKVKPNTMCEQLLKLEETIYDLKKEIISHG